MIPKIQINSVRRVIVLSHTKDEIEEELKIIVRFGVCNRRCNSRTSSLW